MPGVADIQSALLEPVRDKAGRVTALDVKIAYLDGRTSTVRRPMNPFETAALDLWLMRQQRGGTPR